jgi:hypothetical protein
MMILKKGVGAWKKPKTPTLYSLEQGAADKRQKRLGNLLV